MLPFDLLRVPFARVVDFWPQMSRVSTPIIRVESPDPKRLQQRFQLQKYLVLAPAKDIRQDRAGPVIDGMPEPPLLPLLPHKAPHFIDFGVVDPTNEGFFAYPLGIVHFRNAPPEWTEAFFCQCLMSQ